MINTATDNEDSLARFSSEGFVAIPGFMSTRQLLELNAHLDHFIENVVPKLPDERVFYEDKNDPASLKQIQQLGDHDPWFHNLFTVGRFPELAERLLAGPVVPKNIQYFNKPPGIGQPTPPHQDGFYFMLDPCEAITMWLALDHVDEENGCVRYVRGSNHHGMRQHRRTQTLGFSQGIVGFPTDSDLENEVAMHAKPGDLLAHDAMTIHCAGANSSTNRTRRALGLIYYSIRAREDAEAHAAYQRELAEDMKAEGKI